MRSIKFRARSIENSKWIFGHFFHDQQFIDGHPCQDVYMIRDDCDQDHQVDSDTLGQYIDLKGKNGVDIYEGDILSHTYYYSPEMSSDQYKQTDIVEVKVPDFFIWLGSDVVQNSPESTEEFVACMKLIGNIHENPELLEKE